MKLDDIALAANEARRIREEACKGVISLDLRDTYTANITALVMNRRLVAALDGLQEAIRGIIEDHASTIEQLGAAPTPEQALAALTAVETREQVKRDP